MTTRPYELLARFNASGQVAGVSVRTLTTVNGRDYESNPEPLSGATDPAFMAFADAFSASVVAERDQLVADLQERTTERDQLAQSIIDLNGQIESLSSERDGLATQLAAKTAEMTSVVEAKDAELSAAAAALLEAQSAASQASSECNRLNAKIEELIKELPWDKRVIDATAFVGRVTPVELLALTMSDDPVRQQIATMLASYKANDWPVLLDSQEMQQAIGYLTQSGFLTPERSAELLRDSTQAESYRVG